MTFISQPEHLGHLLRNIRHSFGYSRIKMANLIGVTERTIQNYETGHSRLTIENWVRCISILDRQLTDENAKNVLRKEILPDEVAKIVRQML